MTRLAIVTATCAFLLAGCGDRRQPAVRTTPVELPTGLHSPTGSFCPGKTPGTWGRNSGGGATPEVRGGEVDLGTMKLTAPETWVRKAPRFSFTLAEFSLPRAEGDSADGRLTVMLAWGGVEANVARWRQQFGDKLEEESQEELDIGDITGTLVDFSGQYAGQTGMFPSSGQQSSYRMLGAIFPVGSQLAFIKLTGPQKTVAVHADEFLAFVRSVKPHGSDASDQLSEPDETDASRTR